MTYLSRCALLTILVSPFSLANNVLVELSICAKNEDSLQRLVCYDTLAKNNPNVSPNVQNQKLVSASETEKVIQTKSAIQKAPLEPRQLKMGSVAGSQTTPIQSAVDSSKQQQAKFGKENKQKTIELIQQLQATITEVTKANYGRLIITLDNGQVWRQMDSTRLRFKSGQVVIIKRGALGSFFLGRENMNKRISVKRES